MRTKKAKAQTISSAQLQLAAMRSSRERKRMPHAAVIKDKKHTYNRSALKAETRNESKRGQ